MLTIECCAIVPEVLCCVVLLVQRCNDCKFAVFVFVLVVLLVPKVRCDCPCDH
jgi:hypothetical protein